MCLSPKWKSNPQPLDLVWDALTIQLPGLRCRLRRLFGWPEEKNRFYLEIGFAGFLHGEKQENRKKKNWFRICLNIFLNSLFNASSAPLDLRSSDHSDVLYRFFFFCVCKLLNLVVFFFHFCSSPFFQQELDFEQQRIQKTNIIVCTPGKLLQHMDETPNFDCSTLKMLGKWCIF